MDTNMLVKATGSDRSSLESMSPPTNAQSRTLRSPKTWVPILARLIAVVIVSVPATAKFLQYPEMVARFDAWGLPWPEVTVVLAGTVQVIAIVSLVSGVAGRVGAGALAVVMVVAVTTAGADPMNLAVLFAATIILLVGTGPYSYWDPSVAELVSLGRSVLATLRSPLPS